MLHYATVDYLLLIPSRSAFWAYYSEGTVDQSEFPRDSVGSRTDQLYEKTPVLQKGLAFMYKAQDFIGVTLRRQDSRATLRTGLAALKNSSVMAPSTALLNHPCPLGVQGIVVHICCQQQEPTPRAASARICLAPSINLSCQTDRSRSWLDDIN